MEIHWLSSGPGPRASGPGLRAPPRRRHHGAATTAPQPQLPAGNGRASCLSTNVISNQKPPNWWPGPGVGSRDPGPRGLGPKLQSPELGAWGQGSGPGHQARGPEAGAAAGAQGPGPRPGPDAEGRGPCVGRIPGGRGLGRSPLPGGRRTLIPDAFFGRPMGCSRVSICGPLSAEENSKKGAAATAAAAP